MATQNKGMGSLGGQETPVAEARAAFEMAGEPAIGDQLQTLKSDIASLSETVKKLVESELRIGRARVRDALGDASERMRDTVGTVRATSADIAGAASDRARRQYHDLEIAIERNPIAAVGIAAGVGFILGLIHRGGNR